MHTATGADGHKSRQALVSCALMVYALIFCSLSLPAYAQGFPDPPAAPRAGSEQLFSPSIGKRFYEVALQAAGEIADSGQSKTPSYRGRIAEEN